MPLPFPIALPGQRMTTEQMLQAVARDLIQHYERLDASLQMDGVRCVADGRGDTARDVLALRQALAINTLRATQVLDLPMPAALAQTMSELRGR